MHFPTLRAGVELPQPPPAQSPLPVIPLPPCRDQVLRVTARSEEQITLLRVLGKQEELQVSSEGS